MGTSVSCVHSEKGAALWVPFGYITWMISTSPGLTFTAIVPALVDHLWKTTLDLEVQKQMDESFEALLKVAEAMEPWCSSRIALRAWLGSKAK